MKFVLQQLQKTAQRAKSTLIPPKISSLAELGRLQSKHAQAHPQLFAKMKHLYTHIPKGYAAPNKIFSFGSWYYQRYIATSSAVPLLHFLGVMIPTAYYIAYIKGGHYHPRYEFH